MSKDSDHPFHSSKYTDFVPKEQIPIGNIPELKMIELLKDINKSLLVLCAVAGGILGAIIAFGLTK